MKNMFSNNAGLQKFAFALLMATTTLTTSASAAVTTTDDNTHPVSAFETIVQKVTDGLVSSTTQPDNNEDDAITSCANKIDNFYSQLNLPLAGYGKDFAGAAYDEGSDCDLAELAAAIAFRESTGGLHDRNNNPFGWGSAKIKFDSYEDAIREVIAHLAGNREGTAKYYEGKTPKQILNVYNPERIAPGYASRVIATMNKIDSMDDTPPNQQLASK